MAISNESKFAIRRKINELQKRLRILNKEKVRVDKESQDVAASIATITDKINKLQGDL